jgi:biotin carboxylase
MSKAHVVIVDPYSSGALLADSLVERGVPCVAVESSPSLPRSMKSRFDPRLFRQVIPHEGDPNQTLRSIARHEPTHVIAGFESGVELAEWLSCELGLPSNASRDSELRRDKYLMAEAAGRHGLRTALQFRSPHVDELVAWTRSTLDWPVIVKPPKSVASDQVFCCHSIDEVRNAAEAILSGTNVLGSRNAAVLVQEFLRGVEYAVDSVSCEGKHKLTAVWQYDRPVGTSEFVCYDAMHLLPYSGRRQVELRSYAFRALDALGVNFGPSHCELVWTDDGLTLVEVGARLTAGHNAVLSRLCGGICQLDETLQAILAPDQFLAELGSQPRLRKRVVNVFLIPRRRGKLLETRYVPELRQLPTLHSLSVATQPGDELKRVAGIVTLMGSDEDAIQRDLRRIRTFEMEGMFVVEERAST